MSLPAKGCMAYLLGACLLVTVAMGNQQSWSQLTYLNRPHTMSCNMSSGNLSVSSDHLLSWSKLGRDTPIVTDDQYELLNDSGITNMLLRVRSVTPELAGIYFCHVADKNGDSVGRMVRGLNIAGHVYDDKFDEYRTAVIRGVISAACVFVLVVGICLIDNFRYLTDEQKHKKKERKLEQRRRLQKPVKTGVDNLAMEDGVFHVGDDKSNGSPRAKSDSNTYL